MRKIVLIVSGFLLLVLLVFGGFKFSEAYASNSETFAEKTKINGIDCSNLNIEQTVNKLVTEWNKRELNVEEDGKVISRIGDFDFTYDITGKVEKEIKTGISGMFNRHILQKETEINFDMKIDKGKEAFKAKVEPLEFLNTAFSVETKNAYVDMSNTDFKIVKEVYGDDIDKEKFVQYGLECIEKGKWTIEFKPEDFFKKPDLLCDSQTIADKKEYCQNNLSFKITYNFYNGTESISPWDLDKMIDFDNGKGTVNKEEVAKYVEKLSANHNTVGNSRGFSSTGKGRITVYGGDYGYIVDNGGEAEQLGKDLLNGKDLGREPVYAKKAYSSGSDEIGNSYIEVDLAGQHMWAYKNGQQILSTDIVTGNSSKGAGTPGGVYNLKYKDRGATLRGKDFDGTKYETPVEYWMPFNGGIGFHDAPWRTTFGGKIYATAGSHGCINMPPAVAANLFNSISSGYPVILY